MNDNESTIEQIRKELEQAYKDDLIAVQWHVLYLKMTPAERLEMVNLMQERIHSRPAAITAQG